MANTKTQKARRLLQKGLSVNEVIKRGDVSRSIVYKVKNDMIARGELRKTGKPVPTLNNPPPAPTPSIAGLGAFHASKQAPIKRDVVKPKTLWQSIKEWFK